MAVKKNKIDTEETQAVEPITCIARSVECYKNQGHNNFRIVTLHIVDGVVTKIERSDPYANFEAEAKLEIANSYAIMNLNNTWQEGKCFQK